MYILGINGGVRIGNQDTSATLLRDGEVVLAVEEERLNRIKHAPGQLPELSIYECLKKAGIGMKDVDIVVSHGATYGSVYTGILEDYFKYTFGHCPELMFIHHHEAHAASAFWGSSFDKAMVVTFDASGDGVSTQLAVGEGNKINVIKRIARPNSLGIFYSLMTQFCGFRRDCDEYKLMGLSAYGDRNKYDFSWLLDYSNGEFLLNNNALKHVPPGGSQPSRQEMAFSELVLEKLGQKRLKEKEINQTYRDIAASAQNHLENVIVDLVTHFHRQTGIRKLCLAGGVALNCLVNQRLMNLDFIDEIYVHPASSDAGVSMGVAMFASAAKSISPKPVRSALLGMNYDNDIILSVLKASGIRYSHINYPQENAAAQVAGNRIVGWFQDKMEFGPRALGARSILANPAMPDVKKILNDKVKYREEFRPFCPSVTEEDKHIYFEGKAEKSPFMNITYNVAESMRQALPGVTHADGTARIQTVNNSDQPLYYSFLKELKKSTGHAVAVNTSFNTNNEPIVATPYDAIATFYRSGIDSLIIGNYIIQKEGSI
jgi:carbamoyltransferase